MLLHFLNCFIIVMLATQTLGDILQKRSINDPNFPRSVDAFFDNGSEEDLEDNFSNLRYLPLLEQSDHLDKRAAKSDSMKRLQKRNKITTNDILKFGNDKPKHIRIFKKRKRHLVDSVLTKLDNELKDLYQLVKLTSLRKRSINKDKYISKFRKKSQINRRAVENCKPVSITTEVPVKQPQKIPLKELPNDAPLMQLNKELPIICHEIRTPKATPPPTITTIPTITTRRLKTTFRTTTCPTITTTTTEYSTLATVHSTAYSKSTPFNLVTKIISTTKRSDAGRIYPEYFRKFLEASSREIRALEQKKLWLRRKHHPRAVDEVMVLNDFHKHESKEGPNLKVKKSELENKMMNIDDIQSKLEHEHTLSMNEDEVLIKFATNGTNPNNNNNIEISTTERYTTEFQQQQQQPNVYPTNNSPQLQIVPSQAQEEQSKENKMLAKELTSPETDKDPDFFLDHEVRDLEDTELFDALHNLEQDILNIKKSTTLQPMMPQLPDKKRRGKRKASFPDLPIHHILKPKYFVKHNTDSLNRKFEKFSVPTNNYKTETKLDKILHFPSKIHHNILRSEQYSTEITEGNENKTAEDIPDINEMLHEITLEDLTLDESNRCNLTTVEPSECVETNKQQRERETTESSAESVVTSKNIETSTEVNTLYHSPIYINLPTCLPNATTDDGSIENYYLQQLYPTSQQQQTGKAETTVPTSEMNTEGASTHAEVLVIHETHPEEHEIEENEYFPESISDEQHESQTEKQRKKKQHDVVAGSIDSKLQAAHGRHKHKYETTEEADDLVDEIEFEIKQYHNHKPFHIEADGHKTTEKLHEVVEEIEEEIKQHHNHRPFHIVTDETTENADQLIKVIEHQLDEYKKHHHVEHETEAHTEHETEVHTEHETEAHVEHETEEPEHHEEEKPEEVTTEDVDRLINEIEHQLDDYQKHHHQHHVESTEYQTEEHTEHETEEQTEHETEEHMEHNTEEHTENETDEHHTEHEPEEHPEHETEEHHTEHESEEHTEHETEEHHTEHESEEHIEHETEKHIEHETEEHHTENETEEHIEHETEEHHTEHESEEHHTEHESEEHTEHETEEHTEHETEEHHTEHETKEHTEHETEEHHTEHETKEHTEHETEEQTEHETKEHTEHETEEHTEHEKEAHHTEHESGKHTEHETEEHHTEHETEEHTEHETEEHNTEHETEEHTEHETEEHTEHETEEHNTEHETEEHNENQSEETVTEDADHLIDEIKHQLDEFKKHHHHHVESTESKTEEHTEHDAKEHIEHETEEHTEDETEEHTEHETEEHHTEHETEGHHTEHETEEHTEHETEEHHTEHETEEHTEHGTEEHTEHETEEHTEHETEEHNTEHETEENKENPSEETVTEDAEEHTEHETEEHTEHETEEHTVHETEGQSEQEIEENIENTTKELENAATEDADHLIDEIKHQLDEYKQHHSHHAESTQHETEENSEHETEESTEHETEEHTELETEEHTVHETEEHTEHESEEHTEHETEEHTEHESEEHTEHESEEHTVHETEEHTEHETEEHTEHDTEEHREHETEEHTEHETDEHTEGETEKHTEHETEENVEQPTEDVENVIDKIEHALDIYKKHHSHEHKTEHETEENKELETEEHVEHIEPITEEHKESDTEHKTEENVDYTEPITEENVDYTEPITEEQTEHETEENVDHTEPITEEQTEHETEPQIEHETEPQIEHETAENTEYETGENTELKTEAQTELETEDNTELKTEAQTEFETEENTEVPSGNESKEHIEPQSEAADHMTTEDTKHLIEEIEHALDEYKNHLVHTTEHNTVEHGEQETEEVKEHTEQKSEETHPTTDNAEHVIEEIEHQLDIYKKHHHLGGTTEQVTEESEHTDTPEFETTEGNTNTDTEHKVHAVTAVSAVPKKEHNKGKQNKGHQGTKEIADTEPPSSEETIVESTVSNTEAEETETTKNRVEEVVSSKETSTERAADVNKTTNEESAPKETTEHNATEEKIAIGDETTNKQMPVPTTVQTMQENITEGETAETTSKNAASINDESPSASSESTAETPKSAEETFADAPTEPAKEESTSSSKLVGQSTTESVVDKSVSKPATDESSIGTAKEESTLASYTEETVSKSTKDKSLSKSPKGHSTTTESHQITTTYQAKSKTNTSESTSDLYRELSITNKAIHLSTHCNAQDYNSKDHCICSVKTMLKDLLDDVKDINSTKKYQYECTKFIRIDPGIIISNKSESKILRKRKTGDFTDIYVWKREARVGREIEDILNQELNLPQNGNITYVNAGTKVVIPCSDNPEEVNENIDYIWTVENGSPETTGDRANNGSTLVIPAVSAQDSDNYTCTTSDRVSHEQGIHVHRLSVVSLPVYSLVVTVHLNASSQCQPGDMEVLNLYYPVAIKDLLCSGDTEQVCSVMVEKPQCIRLGSEDIIALHATLSTQPLLSILPRLNDNSCNLVCQSRIYSIIVSILFKNLVSVTNLPVFFRLSYRQTELTPIQYKRGDKTNTVSNSIMTICPAGFGIYENPKLCLACEAYSFNPGNEMKCTPCPRGSYQPAIGSRMCLPCNSPLDDASCFLPGAMANISRKYYLIPLITMVVILTLIFGCICLSKRQQQYKEKKKKSKMDIGIQKNSSSKSMQRELSRDNKNNASRSKNNSIEIKVTNPTPPISPRVSKLPTGRKAPPEPPPIDF